MVMFNAKKLWMIAALVCASGLAAAQASFQATHHGGAIDVGGKIAPTQVSAGEAMCFGDGSMYGVKCPLNNPGRPGHGCDNSANMGGAVLRVGGNPSVSHDTVVLGVRGLPMPTTAVYMQANHLRITPKVFGDGLLCLDGPSIRLAVKGSFNSTSKYPEIGEPGAAQTGNIKPGDSVYYQVMYRDSFVGEVGHASFNLSNAWHTSWVP
jgi:hypothetical protein